MLRAVPATTSLRRGILIALAVALALHAALTTTFWHDTTLALGRDRMSYRQRRVHYAFKDIPFDRLAARLDRALPASEPVALPPEIGEIEFLRQRLTETLYPRQVSAAARFHLALVPRAGAEQGRGYPLADAAGLTFVVEGVTAEESPQTPSTIPDMPLRWGSLAACLGGALGLGLAARFALGRAGGGGSGPPLWTVPLLGGLVIAFVISAATWTQLPVPRGTLAGVGLAALAWAAIRAVLARRHVAAIGVAVRRHWEFALLAVLLVLIFARTAAFPVTGWDGRSIWLFNAHRVFGHGMMLKADATLGEALWSHPDYPLLFPAWMATFASLGTTFNERMASLGIPMLLAAALLPAWQLGRAALGRFAGTLMAVSFALAVDRTTGGAYADGYLMLFLVAEFLALGARETEVTGWVAGAAAALTKPEGTVLAAIVAVCVVSLTPAWQGRRWRRRAIPLLWLLPAVAHRLWMSSVGVDSIVKGQALGAVVQGFLPRLQDALRLAPSVLEGAGYTHVRGLLWDGVLAVLMTLMVRVSRSRPFGPLVRAALAAAALQVAFAFLAIAALPEGVPFFTVTALDRLLIHPATLLVLAALLSARAIGDHVDALAPSVAPGQAAREV